MFAPSDGEKLVRITYDAGIGLFLAGGDKGSVFIGFSPDVLAKVWQAPCGANNGPGGFLTAIIPDPSTPANYFVACESSAQFGFPTGRIFEIHSVGPLQFGGTEIAASLPPTLVMTLVADPNQSGVLYAGTRGQGIFQGVRDTSGQWSWQAFNNGMPVGAVVTKLRYDSNTGTIYASTYGRGEFALTTVFLF
jgi:hypothetical protein